MDTQITSKPDHAGAHAFAGIETLDVPASSCDRSRRRYAGRSADELRHERAERLFEAALDLISERGYAKTPIELICARARVTTRHFYEQFSGREDLLGQLYERITSNANTRIGAVLRASELSPDERIQRAVRCFVSSFTDDTRHAQVACIEIVGVSPEMSRLRRKVIDELAVMIEAFLDTFLVREGSARQEIHFTALCIVGGTYELVGDWLGYGERPDKESLVQKILHYYRVMVAGMQVLSNGAPSRFEAMQRVA